jgi:Trk K+ transport system NAD-binding subunit
MTRFDVVILGVGMAGMNAAKRLTAGGKNVAVIDSDRAEVVETLRSTLTEWVDADAAEWSDDELARAREHAKEKYDADEWFRRSP